MRYTPTNIVTGFYADDTMPWSQQDVCNWLPSAAESKGTRTEVMCKTPPGLSPFVEVPGVSGGVRGVYEAEGRLFAAMGQQLYQISNTGVAIPLGTVSGTSRVRFAHNQIENGNQIVAVNGSAGYVYNTATTIFERITDPGYPGGIDAVFIDGFVIQIEPARRYAFHSDLADALSYNTLDRFTSEVSPDLLNGMAVSNNELLLFSEGTGEFFHNTGATVQPFRSKRISFNKGCAGRYAVATLDNTVVWLGDDGVFYLLDGYTPKRISTRAIEQSIRGLNWAQVFATVWETEGHSVCYWTLPDGKTLGYDLAQPPGLQWHRRESFGLERWRVSDMAVWRKRWIAGDFQAGRLWELDWLYPYEGSEVFVSELTGAVVHANQNRILMPYMELLMDTGQPEVPVREFPEQPEGPTISGSAPDGDPHSVYGPFTYATVAGDAPIAAVTLRSGALPAGLTLSSAGTISGTPTESGTFTITVRVTDTSGLWDELTDEIYVAEFAFLVSPDYSSGAGFVLRSINATQWPGHKNTGLGLTVSRMYSLNGAVFVFPGQGNSAARKTVDGGNNWTTVTGLPTTAKNGMTYAVSGAVERYLVFLGSGASAYVSTNGGTSFTSFAVESRTYYHAATLGETVVVMSTLGTLIRSTNGGATFSASFSNGIGLCEYVIATETAFIGASSNPAIGIIRSTTGASGSWAQVATGNGNAGGLAYGDGRIMKLGQNGESSYSDNDGVTFVAGPTIPGFGTGGGATSNLAFAEGTGLFVAVGSTRQIWTTPSTGVPVWTQRESDVDPASFEEVVSVRTG